jgi:hypothetical protein
MRHTLSALLLFVALLTAGCVCADAEAHRAMYEAIAPEYLGYLHDDAELTDEHRQMRRDTVAVWDMLTRDD